VLIHKQPLARQVLLITMSFEAAGYAWLATSMPIIDELVDANQPGIKLFV
jgi:hypothetical protein